TFTSLLATGDWAFVPTLEHSTVLERMGSNIVGALVPREPSVAGEGYAGPLRVRLIGGALTVTDAAVADPHNMSRAKLSNVGRAYYSARDDAVFFVGGEVRGSLANLRRFSFS